MFGQLVSYLTKILLLILQQDGTGQGEAAPCPKHAIWLHVH